MNRSAIQEQRLFLAAMAVGLTCDSSSCSTIDILKGRGRMPRRYQAVVFMNGREFSSNSCFVQVTMAQQREVLEPTLSRVLTPAIIFAMALVFIGYYYSYLIPAMLSPP